MPNLCKAIINFRCLYHSVFEDKCDYRSDDIHGYCKYYKRGYCRSNKAIKQAKEKLLRRLSK